MDKFCIMQLSHTELRLASQIDAESLEYSLVNRREYN